VRARAQVAQGSEVKAMIKLKFHDVSGHDVVATRRMRATQKLKKVSFSTLEGVIKRNVRQTQLDLLRSYYGGFVSMRPFYYFFIF